LKKIIIVFLFSLFILTSCRPESQPFSLPVNLERILEDAASGSDSELYRLGEEGGEGSWFALSAAAREAGYLELASSLQIRSAEKDGAPFGIISLSTLLVENPKVLRNPLRVLKKAEKSYGSDERLRRARITVLADEGKDRALIGEMAFYQGENWEAPVLAAVLRREEADAELEAIVERFILHVDNPQALLQLPEESLGFLSSSYRHLYQGRIASSLDDYQAWLGSDEPGKEVCSLESSPPVFAEMADVAREAGLAEEWAGILREGASDLCGSKRYGASFQAGRLYRDVKDYRKAEEAFLFAAGAVQKGLPRDRAMWYRIKMMYLNPSLSLQKELDAFSRIAGYWEDPGRFDDVLEEFLHRRVRRGEWEALESYYFNWGSFWPGRAESMAAWILAFSRREGRLSGDVRTEEYLETAFESAPWSWSGLRAAGLLGKTPTPALPSSSDSGEDDLILGLYLKWGLDSLAAGTLMKDPSLYGDETIRLTARAMADDNPRLSIRIAGQLWQREDFKPALEDLHLRYPLPFGTLAADTASGAGLPPEIILGLVRTESAWDYQAVSRSGAEGLAQFMPSTWEEWIRRLKLPEDADPMDPETNLTLAAAYLEWLYLREWTFGWPDVLVSYNAGGGRLRSWRRERPGLGEDLFGMSIPLEEPRSYIRKVLSAGTIYGYLYSGKTPRILHEEWGIIER